MRGRSLVLSKDSPTPHDYPLLFWMAMRRGRRSVRLSNQSAATVIAWSLPSLPIGNRYGSGRTPRVLNSASLAFPQAPMAPCTIAIIPAIQFNYPQTPKSFDFVQCSFPMLAIIVGYSLLIHHVAPIATNCTSSSLHQKVAITSPGLPFQNYFPRTPTSLNTHDAKPFVHLRG